MSGTSLDGVDAVLAEWVCTQTRRPVVLGHAHLPFTNSLRNELIALCTPGENEVVRVGLASVALAKHYAQAVQALLQSTQLASHDVMAIGCHGQTIRHQPADGFSVQIGHAALLAELTGIDVVSDFRSRDIAAGGQGAPLLPAFHAVQFADPNESRVVLNLGGIANVTLLPSQGIVSGFDTGPANGLMDAWIHAHLGCDFDRDGAWAAQGVCLPELLHALLEDPYFKRMPPKSTGREYFNMHWLDTFVHGDPRPIDVQATLLQLTAHSVARSLNGQLPARPARMIVCGGGAHNIALMAALQTQLPDIKVESSRAHGIDPMHVEAAGFAWLARATCMGEPGNLVAVTGAKGPRILGSITPA